MSGVRVTRFGSGRVIFAGFDGTIDPADIGEVAAGGVTIIDADDWFVGSDLEAILAELAAKAIGYQAHGNLGATETFDAAIGWHSGTLNANCTFTLIGAPSGTVSSLFLELLQDGTGGRTITLPGSVVNKAALEAAQITTLSTTSFLVLLSRDGGSTWYGGWWGDDAGTATTMWVPAMTYDAGLDAWLVVVTGDGDAVMTEVPI